MKEWSIEILNYIQQYVNHSPILWIYLVSLLFLCFRGKEKRRMLVYPSLLIMLVVMNPVCYGYVWVKLITYAFWRMLWMIPVIPVIACAAVEIAGLFRKDWAAPMLTAAFIVIMVFIGDNIYRKQGVFTRQNNWYKLPDSSVHVAKTILELEDEPLVLSSPYIYCHLRQYSSDIKLVFGRDAETFILPIQDPETLELSQMVLANGGDTTRLVELAEKKGVDIIVLPANHGFVLLGDYGYEYVTQTDGYNLYKHSR